MPRFRPNRALATLAALTLASVCAADEPAAPARAADHPENPIVSGPGSTSATTPLTNPAPRRRRAISPEVAAQLSAAAPKFESKPPTPPPTPIEEQPDLRDLDKPKNDIIRLPKYVVRDRPVVLSERAVHTEKGLAALAMRRYVTEGYQTLNAFTLPLFGSSAEAYAMSRYHEDERLRNMADLEEDARMMSTTDKSAGQYVRKQAQSTYMRPGSFDWRPLGRR